MHFVSVERETHTEVFGKRAVGVGTCNGAHSLCTIFFENINPVPEFIDSAFSFVFFIFWEKSDVTVSGSLRIYLVYRLKIKSYCLKIFVKIRG